MTLWQYRHGTICKSIGLQYTTGSSGQDTFSFPQDSLLSNCHGGAEDCYIITEIMEFFKHKLAENTLCTFSISRQTDLDYSKKVSLKELFHTVICLMWCNSCYPLHNPLRVTKESVKPSQILRLCLERG